MARRSRTSILKRQRELRKAEKAAQKRAKRHGVSIEPLKEPVPTVSLADLVGNSSGSADSDGDTDTDPDRGTD